MNKDQMKRAKEAFGKLEEANNIVTSIQDELSAAIEKRSEEWEESEKGQEARQEHDSLSDAVEYINSALNSLSDAEV